MIDAPRHDLGSDHTENNEPPRSYNFTTLEPRSFDGEPEDAEPPDLFKAISDAEASNPSAEPPVPSPPQPNKNQTRVFILAGAGLAILLVVIFTVIICATGGPEGRYDLGSVTANAVGLKGRLRIEWDKRLTYRLTLEPSDSDLQAGFSLAVAHSLRPSSIEIHLQNSLGFVLCSREIALPFDVKDENVLATPPADQPVQEIDLARLEAQEAARQQGKDIFRNQIGRDGQIASIEAHGVIPCSEKDYKNTTSWSFSADFPSVAEQDELLKRMEVLKAEAAGPSPQAPAIRKRTAAKAAAKLLPFSSEGDDVIVELDLFRGIIETSGRKIFDFNRIGREAVSSRWQEFPVNIHYKCDRSLECVLTCAGAGSLHARLRR
jgi:hypothetical protein